MPHEDKKRNSFLDWLRRFPFFRGDGVKAEAETPDTAPSDRKEGEYTDGAGFLTENQRQYLAEETNRAALQKAAAGVLAQENLVQWENELIGSRQQNPDGALQMIDNEDIHQTLAKLYQKAREGEKQDFDDFFSAAGETREHYMGRVVPILAAMLDTFEEESIGELDYMDPEALSGKLPALLKKGFEALAFSNAVQGTVRSEVSSFQMLKTGVSEQEVNRCWKSLYVLGGARNTSLDICRYFATDAFVRGEASDSLTESLSDCACSLHFVNTGIYRELSQKKLGDMTEAESSYMNFGGDYRAFRTVEKSALEAFLRGEVSGISVLHRRDYIRYLDAVIQEKGRGVPAGVRKPSSYGALENQERSSKDENHKKDSAISDRSHSFGLPSGRNRSDAFSKHADGTRDRRL